jgi:hypothetical protein
MARPVTYTYRFQVGGLAFYVSSITFWRLLAALVWAMKPREAVSVYTTSSSWLVPN